MQQCRLFDRSTASAIRESFTTGIGLCELIFLVPSAVFHEAIHVGAIGALGITVDAQRGLFQGALMLRLIGQGVLTNKVLIHRLIGRSAEIGRLGQHLDLQRHQIPENTGQRDHHINARTTDFGQG